MTLLDIRVIPHGSIVMVTPVSPVAVTWVRDNLDLEPWQWWDNGFAVEPRYLDNLVEGMRDDGLMVG